MMKILLIFTLSLISGAEGCVVTGYSGGSIAIISDLNWGSGLSRYICKLGCISCTYIIHTDTTENSVQEERFKLYINSNGFLTMLIRRLKPQDAGVYRIGVEHQTPIDVKLTVLNDSCCDGPKTVNVFPGQNINIISYYPVIYNRDYKYIMKLEKGSVSDAILDTYNEPQNNRFSISDDRSAKVLGMNISNVTEADDGVYLYGIYNRKNSVEYYSFFREIRLHGRAKAPIEISSMTTDFKSPVNTTTTTTTTTIIIIIIIIVGVCVLRIGGFALLVIYKQRHKGTQVTRPSSQDNEHAPSVYENDLPYLPTYENLNNKMRSNDKNLDSSTNQSDSTYQTLDPLTNQSDSGYMSLTPSTNHIHLHSYF
ncbi:uncharacterized protein LOC113658097 isoform X2 [Tachysurus fulvidraco]|uniref:uncharacterized protein LOC113658097 isoform X2 n=1 Tax=Tachysurus fulvidraco TaxID=1234273 RepID=UPI001FEFE74C|nr:uncharacterized protein LOC113658097 isoform X2 [Tachysurus fulvidraco]